MTTRYIRLPIIVSDTDPSKCSAECPQRNSPHGIVCNAFRDEDGGTVVVHHARHPACIAAEETLS
jgi:hypothetical protein